jgi:hypothetical protein
MKVYMVNAIKKANILNKVNDDIHIYDMFKIFLHTKFHMPAFNISLLVTDKLQKLKTFYTSLICVYLIPQKIFCHATRTGFEVYYDSLSQVLSLPHSSY